MGQLKSLTLDGLQFDFQLSTFKSLVDVCKSLQSIAIGGFATICDKWLEVIGNTTSASTLKHVHICAPCTVRFDDFMDLFGACPVLSVVARCHPSGIWCAKLTRAACSSLRIRSKCSSRYPTN